MFFLLVQKAYVKRKKRLFYILLITCYNKTFSFFQKKKKIIMIKGTLYVILFVFTQHNHCIKYTTKTRLNIKSYGIMRNSHFL